MRITIGIQSLAGGGGTETYVLTVADHLQRAGHDVFVYSAETGPWEARLEELGVRVAIGTQALPGEVDVFLVQDGPSAFDLLGARPEIPQVYVWHSNLFDVQLPPQLPDATRLVVNLYGAQTSRLRAMAIKPPSIQLHQPIDVHRFAPRSPIAPEPKRAVLIGNYLAGERREILKNACLEAGIELELFGAREGNPTTKPEEVMAGADIVFGKSRVVMEAMACGRAAYVYDAFGTDGWVTPENFDLLLETGIAGSSTSKTASASELKMELSGYDQSMGEINRDLAISKLSATRHVGALVTAIEDLLGDQLAPPPNDQAFELARLARVSWRHEINAFGRAAHLQETWSLLAPLQRREEEFDAQALRAAETERTLAAIVNSRRWRLLSMLLRPLDRLRGNI